MPAIQVTATEGGPTGNGILLRVRVLTGVAAVQTGGTGTFSSGSGPASASVTTTVAGSLVYGALALGVETAWTARAGTTITDDHDDTTQFDRYATCQSTAVTGTPGATLFGTTAPTAGSGFYAFAAAEILPNGTIFEDPSGPVLAETDSATSVTSASFSPPAGTLLLAQISSNGGSGSPTTMTVTGGGLNWTPLAEANSHPGMYAGIWIAFAAPLSGDDPPITATQGGSTGPGMVARIKVLTGAAKSALQTGAAVTQSGSAAHQASITTTQAGSIVYGALADGTNTAMTAAASTTLFDNFNDTVHGTYYGTCRTTAVTGTPGAVTVGASAPSSVGGAALAEILPVTPGGTIVEDLSSPVSVTSNSLIALTVNVTPPPGSLLVMMISCDSGAGVETMTVSGGGLAWRALAESHGSGQMYAGVWIADMSSASVPYLPQPSENRRRPRRKIRRQQTMPAIPSGVTDAPVTTSALAVSAAFAAPAVSTDSVVTPPTLSVSATFASPVVSAGSGVTASALNVSAAFASPGIRTDKILTTAVLAGTVSLPPPSISAGSSLTATALGVTATFAAPTVTAGTNASVTSSALSVSATFAAPSVSTGSSLVTSGLSASVSFGAPALHTGETVAPSALAVSAGFGAPALHADEIVTTSALNVSASFPAPTVSAGGSANVAPSVLSCPVSFAAPALSTGVTVTAALLSATSAFAAPSVNAGVTVSPGALSVSAGFSAPALHTGETVTTSALAGSVTFPAPTVRAGSVVAPSALAGSVTFPAPTVTAGGSGNATATPAVLAGSVSFSAPQFRVDVILTAPAFNVSAAFSAPSVPPQTTYGLSSVGGSDLPSAVGQGDAPGSAEGTGGSPDGMAGNSRAADGSIQGQSLLGV